MGKNVSKSGQSNLDLRPGDGRGVEVTDSVDDAGSTAEDALGMDAAEWRHLLAPEGRNLVTHESCTSAAISDAEAALGTALAPDLASLLRFSNGLFDADAQYDVIWPLDRIVADTMERWSATDLRLPRWLVGIGGDNAGDWFCMPSDTASPIVWHWRWIEAEAHPVADDLPSFIPAWLDGHIQV